MQFNQQTWTERFKKLGDEAEGIFENVWARANEPFARYGLLRPEFPMHELSNEARYTPDYMDRHGLIECQGFGKDRIFKFKQEKLEALKVWNWRISPVRVFIWDSVTRQWAVTMVDNFLDWANYPCNVADTYPEGKEWLGWTPDNMPFINWMSYDDPQ
jgi:hypothetical protein